ncbi:M20 family metallopeptidase [Glutamicibacter sp.]|uniref:M20 family metallopeptidase n=1 Tax=Glutamicibacter sp. TaxID=1931995 RepID=UPI0028BDB1FC|nr:M20 family metallopeptidase [Glutamicibacter sp.]
MTTTKEQPSLWKAIEGTIEEIRPELTGLSHDIHGNPELSGEEVFARKAAMRLLKQHGFDADGEQPSAPTAFSMRKGSGELMVTYCVEYDALPNIGHGCGHNVNAAASVGAAIALSSIWRELDVTVHVLGTPAEENIGGKVDLIEEGFFNQSHIALMAHASANDIVGSSSLALNAWDATYRGKAAHAAAAPALGINALDAINIAQHAIALLRQQLPPGSIVSTIVLEGGESVNVIPDRTTLRIEMRAPDSIQLEAINQRVRNCLEAGALASGCNLRTEQLGHTFAELRQDQDLSAAYAAALQGRGRHAVFDSCAVASTDMGNVSHQVPTIHPMIGYEVNGAAHHTEEFARYGTSPQADSALVDAAYALAGAVLLAATDEKQRLRLINHLSK